MIDIKKFHGRPAPPRFNAPCAYRIERSDACIGCGRCIEACLYSCHERKGDDPREMAEPKRGCCRNCFSCVLNCPRGALSMHQDEDYLATGDETFTPAIVKSILDQAALGKIPVSGAGYGGKFAGAGYDGMWTDMSEIVRPTRDGIHGRESISTTINMGRVVSDLCGMRFDEEGNLKSLIPPTREIPMPMMFGLLSRPVPEAAMQSVAYAASELKTYATIDAGDHPERFKEYFNHLSIRMHPDELDTHRNTLKWATVVEFTEGGDAIGAIARAHEINPHLLTILNIFVRSGVEKEIEMLVKEGAETIHLAADYNGVGEGGLSLVDSLQRVHEYLVEKGLRDRITLLASGGIALAEHIPKTIILGADAVVVDEPLLIALECDFCNQCEKGERCKRGLDAIDIRWGASRVINLMIAWRDQLLEVLGAMGIRDVRRLRGERGRAIFADAVLEDFKKRLRKPLTIDEKGFESEQKPREVLAKPTPTKSRFASDIAFTCVTIDRSACIDCGLCIQSCRMGVHSRKEGKAHISEPKHALCIGEACLENDWCCVHQCPERAIRLDATSTPNVLGDFRWTPYLISASWQAAKTGAWPISMQGIETGASGGGFDRLAFVDAPQTEEGALLPEAVDLSMDLNRRSFGRKIRLPFPIYGGGMSYGSISLSVMVGRAMAAKRLGLFTCTGEGGYPDELIPYSEHVITQVATGLFGVREETIRRAPIIEFKYAQGAKPGLGGHLLGEKNTAEVAQMREAVVGTSLFSPFPFHSVYSVEDHKKHLDWIRSIHPEALLSVKVSTPGDVDMVAVGSYYAGANIIHLDGAYGGTGAAPDIAKKNIAQPIEYAVTQAHDFLSTEGIREKIVLIASGGIRTPYDVLKAIALGADGVVIGTAELVAIDCVRCGNCERDRGCPIGIATTDKALAQYLDADFVQTRIANLYLAWAEVMRRKLAQWGLESVRALRGRRDLLRFIDDESETEAKR